MLVVANRVPVSDGREAAFVERFEREAARIRDRPGFRGVELLSPVEGATHIIQSYWDSREAFEAWRNSRDFADAHADLPADMFDGENQLELYERTFEIENPTASD